MWGFPKTRGTLLGGPFNRDYSTLGSILGSLYFGKLPCGESEEGLTVLGCYSGT